MPITIIPAADTTQIRIEGEFNIYTAADSKQQLMDALNAHPAFSLELDAVEEIDTSGVQLLLWVKCEAQRIGKPLTVSGASPAIQEVMALLNLAGFSANQSDAEVPA
jgi:anti-sigma B factor antagonist